MILLNGVVQDAFVAVVSTFATVAMKTATKKSAIMKPFLCSAHSNLSVLISDLISDPSFVMKN